MKNFRCSLLGLPAAIVLLAGWPLAASAHHSAFGYDRQTIREIEGEVIDVKWRNPHVMISLRETTESGEAVNWELEAGSIYWLARAGIAESPVSIGDRITVAGNPNARGKPELGLNNLLLTDGREIIMSTDGEPYWSAGNGVLGGSDLRTVADSGTDQTTADGLFRVWSKSPRREERGGSVFALLQNLPLTARARTARERIDVLEEDPVLRCVTPGMPRTLMGPHPIQFVRRPGDEDIELFVGEFDIRRTIHVGATEAEANDWPYSKQGFSRGQWADDAQTVLEVTTTRVSWPYFEGVTPQSRAVEMIERFSLTEDGRRLNYELTVTDPMTFTEPVIFPHLIWVDLGEPMSTFNCGVERVY